jgi:integrase
MFYPVGNIYVLNIREDNRSPDQTLKTKPSRRIVPLHSAVLEEGFISYVQGLPEGPLFPQIGLDSYGRRSGKISNVLSFWLRQKVGITDSRKPFYSHRHTVITMLRNATTVKEDVERYLVGHARAGEHGNYGEYNTPPLRDAIEVIPNPL